MTEEGGYLEAEGAERTFNLRQEDIKAAVDESSARKAFSLKLTDFGPYCTRYTPNGRFVLVVVCVHVHVHVCVC